MTETKQSGGHRASCGRFQEALRAGAGGGAATGRSLEQPRGKDSGTNSPKCLAQSGGGLLQQKHFWKKIFTSSDPHHDTYRYILKTLSEIDSTF